MARPGLVAAGPAAPVLPRRSSPLEEAVGMTRRLAHILVLAVLAGLMPVTSASAQADARAIMDRIDRLLRGDSSHGVVTMEVVTEHWERRMTMEIWSLGTDYALVRLLAPKKEAGIATLRVEDNIWNYLPKVDRTIKIPATMMGGSWMGSHFTNDDLVKQSRLIDDYDIAIAFAGVAADSAGAAGAAVWDFVLTPKPEAAVVWGHIDYRVRQDDLMPLRARYYDEQGRLARTMAFGGFRELGGRRVPADMHVHPADAPGERTTVRYRELEFDIALEPPFFSLRNLKKGR